jgi:hypothetical protein
MRPAFRAVRIAIVAGAFAAAAGGAAEPPKLGGSLRLRAEGWSWFETAGRDDEYTFLGALLRVAASQRRERFDWTVEAAVPALAGLPRNAVAPPPQGQLGFGGSYFAANGESDAAALVLKQGFVRFRGPQDSLRVGRFELIDGTEVTPKNAMLAALKSGRIAHRLIGNFAFSHVGRSVDGVHYVHSTPALDVTAVAFRPTAGSLVVEANDQLAIDAAYGALTRSAAAADARLFVLGYRDRRTAMKTDNRPLAARTADRGRVELWVLGGHYLAAFGNADLLLWAAAQGGRWGALDHGAHAVDVEGGYHWPGATKPVLRAGFSRSSGDSDPGDGRHETFFQVLPTPRIYARFPFYNAMNSTDVFLQASLRPLPKLTVASELHVLTLTERADLWYSGGGAFDRRNFGFAGRPASGGDDLARVLDVSVDYAVDAKTSVTLYLAAADGGDVVRRLFAGGQARLAYLEVTRRF